MGSVFGDGMQYADCPPGRPFYALRMGWVLEIRRGNRSSVGALGALSPMVGPSAAGVDPGLLCPRCYFRGLCPEEPCPVAFFVEHRCGSPPPFPTRVSARQSLPPACISSLGRSSSGSMSSSLWNSPHSPKGTTSPLPVVSWGNTAWALSKAHIIDVSSLPGVPVENKKLMQCGIFSK